MNTKIFIVTFSLFTVFSSFAQEARYGIKSAVISKVIFDALGQKIEGIQYIDDHGNKESVSVNMPHLETVDAFYIIRTINSGDTVIKINMDDKTGQIDVLREKPVNYLNITQEVRAKYNIKELGQEEIAGRLCDRYSMEYMQKDLRILTNIWIWKGIVLKSEYTDGAIYITELATDVKENINVSDEHFIIPDNITIQ